MPSKSNSQTRWNNAVPKPSTWSAYRNGNGGEVFANSRRSSCLRSVNRSVRKSFPSWFNKSNAKKHGGFPRWNRRFLNCGLPRLSRQQISPSMTALVFSKESEIDSASAEKEANGLPLREISWQRPDLMRARARKPSYFSCKLADARSMLKTLSRIASSQGKRAAYEAAFQPRQHERF